MVKRPKKKYASQKKITRTFMTKVDLTGPSQKEKEKVCMSDLRRFRFGMLEGRWRDGGGMAKRWWGGGGAEAIFKLGI